MNTRLHKLLLLGNLILGLVALSAKAATSKPVIGTQPVATLTAQAGITTAPSIKVVASGTTPLYYQWHQNGLPVPGATSATLAFPASVPAQSGAYTVIITNYLGSVTSRVSQVTLWQPVAITQQPASQSVIVGNTATLNVAATGYPAPTYQWKFNGANLAGATSPQLLLPNAQTNQSGAYTVTLANGYSTVTSTAATLAVGTPPVITEQPLGGLVYNWDSKFDLKPKYEGSEPKTYQWYFNGAPIVGSNKDSHTAYPTAGSIGWYYVVVSSPFGTATSAPAYLNVGGIATVASSQTVLPGENAQFTYTFLGNPGPACQWFGTGGFPITGATNASLTFTNVSPADSGTYYLEFRYAGAEYTYVLTPVTLLVNIPPLPFANVFAQRGSFTGLTGSGRNNNIGAGTEDGEPATYAYKPKRSVWSRWVAPTNGVVVMDTAGSEFDTILGVFVGSSVTNLTLVAADDDSGGFLNSKLMFNAQAGVEYNLVVAGYAGAEGNFVLSWHLTPSDVIIPAVTQPRGFAGTLGNPAVLSLAFTNNSDPVSVQWHFEGQPILDATNVTYEIPSLALAHLGAYHACLATGPFAWQSRIVELQVNTEGLQHALAQNRQNDAAQSGINGWTVPTGGLRRRITAVAGYSGSQIFATRFGKDPLEPNHCGVVGGSSYWLSYVPPVTGVIQLNTAGSSYDTILAAYIDDGKGNGYASLISVACNNDVSPSNLTSKVSFNATAGVTYYIVVDGKNGAYGTAYLNYSVSAPPTITTLAAMTILEDASTGARAFTIGDAETAATNLLVTATCSNPAIVPASGLVLGGTGASRTLNVIPATNANGIVTITLTVTDAAGVATSSAFTLTITAVNDAPVAGTDTVYRVLNGNVTIPITTLLANDTDVDGNPRTLTAVASLSFLGATITKTSTSVTYTRKLNANGPDYFTYTISDGAGKTATGRVNVYVQ